MPDQNVFTFPKDLFDARRELHEIHAEIRTMQADRPWSVEPSNGWDDSAKWYPSVRPATDGWSAEDTEAYTALQERARELSAFVICHWFWSEVDAADRAEARSKLIHTTQPAAAEPAATA
ncbi:hypothetical protein ACWD3I_25300 [Streptomyces sp. NPDC002817]|uniref:hypothetical protein n=1 Tax=Streptomyces sp. NPDC088357 TaxID=3154655 RepID=UPI0034435E44